MRRTFPFVLVVVLGLGACAASSTGATATPRADPSIGGLDDAIDRYKEERYAEAAWGFSEIAAGRLPGDPQVAMFWLGKACYHLDDHRQAAAIFAAIAAAPEHPSHLLNLAWLVQLRAIHPEDRELLRAFGGYDLEVLEHPDYVFVADELRVAFAAHRFAAGDVESAYALAARVAPEEDAYAESQLIAGLAADKLGRRHEAVRRLKEAAKEPAKPTKAQAQARGGSVASSRAAARARIRAQARRELERRGVPIDA